MSYKLARRRAERLARVQADNQAARSRIVAGQSVGMNLTAPQRVSTQVSSTGLVSRNRNVSYSGSGEAGYSSEWTGSAHTSDPVVIDSRWSTTIST